MKAFFEAIQSLFVDFLFKPLDWLRALELDNWWLANSISWILIAICGYYIYYWIKQLRIFDEAGTENQDTTAHSFLK